MGAVLAQLHAGRRNSLEEYHSSVHNPKRDAFLSYKRVVSSTLTLGGVVVIPLPCGMKGNTRPVRSSTAGL